MEGEKHLREGKWTDAFANNSRVFEFCPNSRRAVLAVLETEFHADDKALLTEGMKLMKRIMKQMAAFLAEGGKWRENDT